MCKLVPAIALVALSLGGCSTISDFTSSLSEKPRPQRVLSGDDAFMRTAQPMPQPVRPIRPQAPRVIPVAAEPDDMASDVPVEAPLAQVSRRPLAEEPAMEEPEVPASSKRFNVAAARDQINAYRAEDGLDALSMDPALMRAAKAQSDAMARAESMDHGVGGSFASRMAKVGIEEVPAAENIAAGYANVSAVIKGWQASPAHDANLRMKEATRLGIAATASRQQPDKLYWTLIIAGE
jgi:uncharacterized protein YkwD